MQRSGIEEGFHCHRGNLSPSQNPSKLDMMPTLLAALLSALPVAPQLPQRMLLPPTRTTQILLPNTVGRNSADFQAACWI